MNFFDNLFDFDGDGVTSPFEELLGFSILKGLDDENESDLLDDIDLFGDD